MTLTNPTRPTAVGPWPCQDSDGPARTPATVVNPFAKKQGNPFPDDLIIRFGGECASAPDTPLYASLSIVWLQGKVLITMVVIFCYNRH